MKKVISFLKTMFPHAAVVGVILFALHWYAGQMESQGQAKANAQFEAIETQLAHQQKEMQIYIDQSAADLKAHTDERLKDLSTKTSQSHTTIIREAQTHPWTLDENQGITQGMLDEINKARAESRK